ncbi:MAG: putative membrane protein, partial [uncultured Blastococcus sp.]
GGWTGSAAGRRGGAGARRRRVDRRHRGRRRPGQRQGRRRRRRRHRRHAAVRARAERRARAADHPQDRGRLAAQQAAHHPAGDPAAQPVPAVAADPDTHDRRRLPLLRGRGEDLAPDHRACRGTRGGGGRAPGREDHRDRGRAHRLHPVGGDHGHLAQRGRRRGLLGAGDHPGGRRARHHRAGVRRRGRDREDGRRRSEPVPAAGQGGGRFRPRARQGHAEAADRPDRHRYRRDAVGRRAHHPAGHRRAGLPPDLRVRPPPRGGGEGGHRRRRRCRGLAGQHPRQRGPRAGRRRAHRPRHHPHGAPPQEAGRRPL